MKVFFILIFLGIYPCIYADEAVVCSDDYCKSYLATEKCAAVPEMCEVQNATHNGIFLPSAGPCNCCEYCLENLEEGDTCAVGDPSSPIPTTICGHSLACTPFGGETVCQTMDTQCTKAQKDYDDKRKDGQLGHLEMRPMCDRNGFYEPYMCIPGEICYCVSENGERIFGEIPFTALAKYMLRCKCSRNYNTGDEVNSKKLHQGQHFRCDASGDYDTLQCIGEQCLCVDAEDGHPTFPEMELVNMMLISATTLPCFNNKTHSEAEYYRECEADYIQRLEETREYEKQGFEVLGLSLPNCQPDGYYARVQENTTIKYCADPWGNVLEDFALPNSDVLSVSMNCNCARARSIIQDGEKPECCKNGNYKSVQCRRGLCRCVDKNGIQTEKEVEYYEKQSLPCISDVCT